MERVRRDYVAERVKDGMFGAMMSVALVNDVNLSALFLVSESHMVMQ